MSKPIILRATTVPPFWRAHYIAQITGRDLRYHMERTFLAYSEWNTFKKELEFSVTTPGLYITCNGIENGKRVENFHLIALDKRGEFVMRSLSKEETRFFAHLMDRIGFTEAVKEMFPEEDERERQLELFFS